MLTKHGLTDQEVLLSREKNGSNQLTEQPRESFLQKLWGNFKDPMIQILCVALVLNLIFAILGEAAWYEAVGIAIAVLLAVLVSTFSEYRNESAFQKLQEDASQILCKVYRNGAPIQLPISEIVAGDIVLLQTGDKVPADGFLVEGDLKVDQSALNGEAEEAEKLALPNGEVPQDNGLDFLHPNRVFRGSVIYSGNALVEITAVGDASIYGNLAGELQLEEDRDSPLKVKLKSLATTISRFGYLGGILIAVVFLFQTIVVANGFNLAAIAAYCGSGMPLLHDILGAVMLAVIIIVMAVPEGLPLMIAIVSAQNMGKMLRDQVLVRKVNGIETAGSLNLLFSDKTGTITKGQLETVVFLDGASQTYQSFSTLSAPLQDLTALNIRKSTQAVVTQSEGKLTILGGNATDKALIEFVGCTEVPDVSVLHSVPFSSDKKYSFTTVAADSAPLTLIKGAPEKLLNHCQFYYDAHGKPQPLSDDRKTLLDAEMDQLARRAIRVLLLAVTHEEAVGTDLPQGGWTLIGIAGIRDEVRPEAVTAIAQVQAAGVQAVMITGDRKDTAAAIAREAGLLQSDTDLILTSDELAGFSDEEIASMLPNIRVIARALPSDKSRLVRIGQDLNLVVGMTGDGVNDSPALKRADVGFAMGSGTEVAKEAGDIVILDDNFQSVAKAVLYGRTIFNSIRKFIVFQLTINVSAVLISFIAPLIGMESPLSITQILWINLVMDTLAALAFGGEPPLERYMHEPPKRRDESLVSTNMMSSILVGGLWVVLLGLLFLLSPAMTALFRSAANDAYHMTGFFTFFIFAAIFNAFNARTESRNLFEHLGKNTGFLKVMGLIVVVQVTLTQFGGPVFRCFGLTGGEWAIALALAILIIPVDLLRKTLLARK